MMWWNKRHIVRTYLILFFQLKWKLWCKNEKFSLIRNHTVTSVKIKVSSVPLTPRGNVFMSTATKMSWLELRGQRSLWPQKTHLWLLLSKLYNSHINIVTFCKNSSFQLRQLTMCRTKQLWCSDSSSHHVLQLWFELWLLIVSGWTVITVLIFWRVHVFSTEDVHVSFSSVLLPAKHHLISMLAFSSQQLQCSLTEPDRWWWRCSGLWLF